MRSLKKQACVSMVSLRGETEYKPGELISVTSRSDSRYSPLAIETPLPPGKQFLLLPVYREDKSRPLELERCLVLPDTPETRNQLEAGCGPER